MRFYETCPHAKNWRNFHEGTRFSLSREDAEIVSNYPYPLVRFIMLEFAGGNFDAKLVK